MTESFARIPVALKKPDTASFTETYGFTGSQGFVTVEGQLLRKADTGADTLFVFMHPTSTLHLLPMPIALAESGFHVLCAASRYPKNDSALVMEKVIVDLGVWVRWAREEQGYAKVVLVGWSGGGSLSLFYQAEAENPSITETPAGDPIDIRSANLLPADGVIFIAAHLSRAETLTEWLDPSVLDESDPDRRDPALDIYGETCPNSPPFSSDFISDFRAAQRARNARITAWCLDWLERLRRRGGAELERPFIVHRTMCDPRWIDPALDPNDRRPGWCYLGDPRAVNVGPVGLARFTTLRSWLSQWSYEFSNATSGRNAPRIRRTPVLQIENSADDAVPATHNPRIHQLLGTSDKEYERIDGATHYYLGQPELLSRCLAAVGDWSRRHGFLDQSD